PEKLPGFRELDLDGFVVARQHAAAHPADDQPPIPGHHHLTVTQIARDAETPGGALRPADLGVTATPGAWKFEAHTSIVTPTCNFSARREPYRGGTGPSLVSRKVGQPACLAASVCSLSLARSSGCSSNQA